MDEAGRTNVIGLGYVGLTLSLALAQRGIHVNGIENNSVLADKLKGGKPHFFEAGLEDILTKQLDEQTFEINGNMEKNNSYILCVGAPYNHTKAQANLMPLTKACQTIGAYLKPGDLVINRSTVPVGTTKRVLTPILERVSGLSREQFDIAYAPERTLEGRAMHELFNNPQIIGGYTQQAVERASTLFSNISPQIIPVSSIESAETAKLFDNTWRHAVFGISNELALIAEGLGVDVHEIISAVNKDYPRNRIAFPSPGVGGSCLLKDPRYLLNSVSDSTTPSIIRAAQYINEDMPRHMVERIYNRLDPLDKGTLNFFLAGFAFKGEPVTSDLRDSTSLWFLDALKKKKARITGYDPVVPREELQQLDIRIVKNYREGFEGADCVVILNNHRSYSTWNLEELVPLMHTPGIIYDSWRKLTLPPNFAKAGIDYLSVGK